VTVTDTMRVHYPTDDELRALTSEHPGVLSRFGPGGKRAGRTAARALAGSVRRSWARVRGCLGSLTAFGTATAATFVGWGLVPGLFVTAVSLVLSEKLLESQKDARR
jgi:hypothetical protein